jgi:hypothetical protein
VEVYGVNNFGTGNFIIRMAALQSSIAM